MIKHVKCDIFKSSADVICHQVNCQGAMNSGIAKQVRDMYPKVYEQYKSKCNGVTPKDLLGSAQWVGTFDEYGTQFLGIFNLFGQEKYGYDGKCYTNYYALRQCFQEVYRIVSGLHTRLNVKLTIAIPYLMSCHRGGGDWDVVYNIISEIFENTNIDVLICEYDGG